MMKKEVTKKPAFRLKNQKPKFTPEPIESKELLVKAAPICEKIETVCVEAEIKHEIKKEEPENENGQELIEKIDFYNGENRLSLHFSKKNVNRMYRVQIFLNDCVEIRNVTYTGATTGISFWNMLKGLLNKK